MCLKNKKFYFEIIIDSQKEIEKFLFIFHKSERFIVQNFSFAKNFQFLLLGRFRYRFSFLSKNVSQFRKISGNIERELILRISCNFLVCYTLTLIAVYRYLADEIAP